MTRRICERRPSETKIGINCFVRTIATIAIGYGAVFEWSADRLQIFPTLHLRDVAMATTFWLLMGYKL